MGRSGTDGKVHAYDAATREFKWSSATGGYVSSPSSKGSSGTVYVGAKDGNIYPLDVTTGSRGGWTYTAGGDLSSPPVVSGDGKTLFFGSLDRRVYALDTSTWVLRWNYSTGGEVVSSPALSFDDSIVYVGPLDGKLYALDAATGVKRWSYTTGGGLASSPLVSADGFLVYVASKDKSVHALKTASESSMFPTLKVSVVGGAGNAMELECRASASVSTAAPAVCLKSTTGKSISGGSSLGRPRFLLLITFASAIASCTLRLAAAL